MKKAVLAGALVAALFASVFVGSGVAYAEPPDRDAEGRHGASVNDPGRVFTFGECVSWASTDPDGFFATEILPDIIGGDFENASDLRDFPMRCWSSAPGNQF